MECKSHRKRIGVADVRTLDTNLFLLPYLYTCPTSDYVSVCQCLSDMPWDGQVLHGLLARVEPREISIALPRG